MFLYVTKDVNLLMVLINLQRFCDDVNLNIYILLSATKKQKKKFCNK